MQIPRLSHSFPQRRQPPSARGSAAANANAAFTFSWQPPDLGSPLSRISSVDAMSTLSDEYLSSPGDALSWTDAATVRKEHPAFPSAGSLGLVQRTEFPQDCSTILSQVRVWCELREPEWLRSVQACCAWAARPLSLASLC